MARARYAKSQRAAERKAEEARQRERDQRIRAAQRSALKQQLLQTPPDDLLKLGALLEQLQALDRAG